MVTQLSIVRYLNSLLDIRSIPDASHNGMQVNAKHGEIKKIGFAVDACTRSVMLASKAGCQMLVVHHGIRWKGARDYLGINRRIAELCRRKGISLYGVHLPLDMHNPLGHNYQTAMALGLKDLKGFGDYHGVDIGCMGNVRPTTSRELAKKLDRLNGSRSVVFQNLLRKIRRVGVVTGGGGSTIFDACKHKLDLLITGEAPHNITLFAREIGMDLVLGGHYHTEQVGLKALLRHLEEKFNIQTQYLDTENATRR